MADNLIVTVPTANNLIVTVQDTSLISASTNLVNPSHVESIGNIGDVDMNTNGKTNGSVLVYKATTNKWTSTTTMDAQNIECGEF